MPANETPPVDPAAPAEPSPTRRRRLFRAYVEFAQRRSGRLVALFGGLALVALGLSLRLGIETDMAELLPANHPSVIALRNLAGRQKSATNLVVLLHGPDGDANHRFAEALRPELERMIPRTFTEIQWRPDAELPAYANRWKWLYADLADLVHADELLDRIVARRTLPVVDLEGDAEAELRALRERLDQRLPPLHHAPYFEYDDHGTHYLGIMLWRRRDGLATRGDHETLAEVKALVERTQPRRFHAGLVVEYTGHIAQAIDEQNGVRDDLTLATLICATLVLASIYLYFRRFGLILVIGAPVVLGLLLALALASLTIHHLNVNTAFLISIILGNGINSPIILLARYGEERRRGHDVATALTEALDGALVGTLSAMAAASIAYGSLVITSFRGFNQFGLLGGAGMLLVWLLTFALVPPLVVLGERWRPGALTPRGRAWQRPFAWLGRLSERRPLLLAALSLALVVIALRPLRRYAADPLEWNFGNLRSDETPAQRLWSRMDQLGMGNLGAGYIGNNGVVLVERPEQADAVAEAMRQKDAAKGAAHVLREVRTLGSLLPRQQDEKLALLARVRAKIDRHRGLLDPREAAELDSWRPPDTLRPVVIADLPRLMHEAFTEVDGQRGRLIGIDADFTNYSDWNGHDLLRIADALQVDALGRHWVAASAATVFAGMLEAIIADGPRVTLLALIGVLLLILLAFGPRADGAWAVLAALAIGLVWLGGLLGALDLKINFMNFVALPITLGVGADYAANMWARLRSDRSAPIGRLIADTGSAVALCSWTTIIGYSSLLMSHNRALRSFGLLADLGEITCLGAALVALPTFPVLLRRLRRAP